VTTKLIRLTKNFSPSWRASVLAIGNFDGVHVGHSSLIRKLIAETASIPGAVSVVQSFYPHPSQVLNPSLVFRPITNTRKKLQLLSELGVNFLAELRFTKSLSQLTAAQYIDEFWIKRSKVCHLVLGPDTAIGKDRQGGTQLITEYCQSKGIGVSIVEFVKDGDSKYGSREIRRLITESDFKSAEKALSRKFSIVGRVVAGDQRGRSIGFRTANIHSGNNLLPTNGVYACRVLLQGVSYKSVVNIGFRPTFGGGRQVTEVHLLGYEGPEFYGSRLEVFFEERLRAEQKFASVEELKAQIQRDILTAQEYFNRG
jgi:riboflavin kinase/FMN adenylyltransferase